MKLTHNGQEFEIEVERKGNAAILRHGDVTHSWTPHPRVGRTRQQLESEFNEALATFGALIAGHRETSGHLDDLFGQISDTVSENSGPSSKHEAESGELAQLATNGAPNDDVDRIS